ncbi:MAG: transposase [Spirochaetes bacterium]|jgi:putative transposase|nr:transposase [Spirochaetota bacterium]
MRKPREIQEGATYHVCAKINRSEKIFESDKSNFTMFMEYIDKAHEKYSFKLINVCIMSNHVHMLIIPGKGSSLANIMKSILGGFARAYNVKNGIKGHVWYDRFKSKIVGQLEQFVRTLVYISNNPIRAAIVDHPLKYYYSSIYAFFSNETTPIVKLLRRITNGFDDSVRDVLGVFLESFDIKKAGNYEPSLSFPAGKPGRPPKKKDTATPKN